MLIFKGFLLREPLPAVRERNVGNLRAQPSHLTLRKRSLSTAVVLDAHWHLRLLRLLIGTYTEPHTCTQKRHTTCCVQWTLEPSISSFLSAALWSNYDMKEAPGRRELTPQRARLVQTASWQLRWHFYMQRTQDWSREELRRWRAFVTRVVRR